MRSDEKAGNNELRKNQEFLPNLCEIAFAKLCIEISYNFYSNQKKIFAQLLIDFRTKKFDWKPYICCLYCFITVQTNKTFI